jgi:hypothetical protein
VSQPPPYTTDSLNRTVQNLILSNGDVYIPLTFKNGIVRARLISFGDARPLFQPFEIQKYIESVRFEPGGSALFFLWPSCGTSKLRKALSPRLRLNTTIPR